MASPSQNPVCSPSAASQFTATHWTMVLLAGGDPNVGLAGTSGSQRATQAAEALERLCRTYWFPLYAFLRRKGYSPHDAEDLTQAFFARILEKGYLKAVDRNKGKFRSFLLGALDHFIANEWRRANAQKRGGKLCFLSLDEQTAEERYLQVAASDLSPEKVLEQRWAMALLEQVLSRLRAEFVAAAKGHLFEQLKIFLTGEKKPAAYSELAATLQTSEAALKMSVSRLRQRYGELLRAEIANTVSSPAEVEEELRNLFAALS
ncbi:MAG TPA: sigma-70 family RNA polymerase sigma factor [Verrucomicrobiae bacterium]|nr:sigma-70 family RNA polymerase sigma factor [Verrucomicrobiae bacterium]